MVSPCFVFYKSRTRRLLRQNALLLWTRFIPQTELMMRGSRGIGQGSWKGSWKVRGALAVHFDQNKPVLGKAVATANINIYDTKLIFFRPDGSSPDRPGLSLTQARFGKSGKLKIQKFGILQHIKSESSQNTNPCRPKCRQGLDCPEKVLPSLMWGHPKQFFHGPKKMQTL